ncbi:hypothetical protein NC661_13455 [Aquibacillus koreensis]|uniref:N-acetyltransferase domain-containing protein n=1 Tax=Aquibacillus koreensis TaxID=279446 RepID=A0A9X3WJT4_9BACI|nr:hypothetical protein [Aquibacillus koreensis]MCT2536271.1 hypothetical protein [Aquibacillus koreensis]MDC3421377.1 hypothetical protein [Aquibacillus koreensis]
MQTVFKPFNNSYYEAVCDFLIVLSKGERKHINWNWARWEWMFFHPEFDNSLAEKIGLWFDGDDLIGMTTYDHYYGEAFFAVQKGYEGLEKEILEYAINTFSNENGLGIAVNESDSYTIDLLHSYGFRKDTNSENILEKHLEFNNFDYTLPNGIKIKSMNLKEDFYKRHKVLWEGFENEGDLPFDEQTVIQQKRMLNAPH